MAATTNSGIESELAIIIAGSGPAGAIAALALARQGLAVRVFEAESEIDHAPRAATTHAATLEMLADLQLFDEIIRRGMIEPRFRFWDRASGRMVAEFDFRVLDRDTPYPFTVQCEQHKLVDIAIAQLRAFSHASGEFAAKVTSVQQFPGHVVITVQRGLITRQVAGSYLIGCDGGRSRIRKLLGITFEGYTHPERFLVLTTSHAFGGVVAECSRNFFCDPDEWVAMFKVAGDDGKGLWRIVFPTRPDETDREAFDETAVQARLQRFLPRAGRYPVVHRNIYKVHQRVAASFRKGRVFLAGDAAHVNNPLGGLGLNFAIHDAIELANLLGCVIRQEVPGTALDFYDDRRRPLNIEHVQRQTIDNKKLLEEKDSAVRAANFETLRRRAADRKEHRAYLLRASLIESARAGIARGSFHAKHWWKDRVAHEGNA